MTKLIVADVPVRMDSNGRYSLNDLHKAAGAEKRHGPTYWLENQSTREIIAELETTDIPVVKIEGRNGGTFVCKELVYSYAMWISGAFQLRVIRAYDALVEGRIDEAQRIASRQTARLEAPHMTEAIKHARESKGKPVMPYHFSNEFDLVNRVAIGKTSKQYRAAHGIEQSEPLRDHLTPLETKCIEALQRANTALIDLGFDYEARKVELHKLYVLRHAAGLLAEVKRLES